jgi:anaerobic selenocysteine-containing dehydrogenase
MGPKGHKAIQMHYHPKRINHALKRVGERGEDKWEQIPYDQALDEIAAKLAEIKEKYGPESLVASEGTYRSDHLWARTRFFNLFGNPGNIVDPGTVCWCWNYTINMSMTGWPIEGAAPTTPMQTGTFVAWGKRVSESFAPQASVWRSYLAALNRDGEKPKMIVIDPTCTTQSTMADQWLAIYPGTDTALAMGWINYILQEKLYQEQFLKDWSNCVFLVNKDTNKIVRGDEFSKDGAHDEFIAWNEKTGAPALWNSDENHWYDAEVAPSLEGEHDIKLVDGKTIKCCTVFDKLKERAAQYPLEEVSKITGIPVTQIRDSARTYATNGPAYIAWGIGGGDQEGYNATYSAVAKTVLRIITGNIDNPGGEYIGEPGPVPEPGVGKTFPMRDSELELSEMLPDDVKEKFIGNDQFRVMSWKGFGPIDKCYRKMFDIPRPMLHQMLCAPPLVWDAIEKGEPYPVKAMICWSSNPMAWAPNLKHVYKVLKKLELLVVVEYWKTPTAALADYIMPACDSLERPMAGTLEDSTDFSVYGDRGCKPVGDRHMDYDFFRGLGVRLGQEEYWPWKTYEEVVEHRIERVPDLDYTKAVETGMYFPSPQRCYKYGETLPNGQIKGFATTSRKLELWSTLLEDLDYDPLPFYRELPETPLSNPELAKEYPMRLTIGGRISTLYHSEQRVPGQGTRSMWPWPTVQIHIEDARKYGIRPGDWVWIETPRGRIRQKAQVDMGIVKGVVQAQPSWWYPELPAEEPWSQGVFDCGGNVLTDDSIESLDPATANWITRGLLCKIYPCIDPADRTDQEVTGEDLATGKSYFNGLYDKLG